MSEYTRLARAIIESMESIIGPVARTQANNVEGLRVNNKVTIDGDPQTTIKKLIEKYCSLMGPVAITIAKKGARQIMEKNPKLKVLKELR